MFISQRTQPASASRYNYVARREVVSRWLYALVKSTAKDLDHHIGWIGGLWQHQRLRPLVDSQMVVVVVPSALARRRQWCGARTNIGTLGVCPSSTHSQRIHNHHDTRQCAAAAPCNLVHGYNYGECTPPNRVHPANGVCMGPYAPMKRVANHVSLRLLCHFPKLGFLRLRLDVCAQWYFI
jgi:hypothetical protein